MLARRACARVRTAVAVQSRPFVAAAAVQSPARAPTLADITPESAASFTEKQKKFRDGLVAAQKQREQQESWYHARGRVCSKESPC
jgi:cell pole-organizing protein PopZ